ncbi:MAG TPA: PASTA domain-containing protein [Actinopolymorphaceae bacterium]
MSTAWKISSSTTHVELDGDGRGEVTFTVTNPSDTKDEARFEVVPVGDAEPSWFEVEDPQRLLLPGWSAAYVVRIAVPSAARDRATGTYALRGKVGSVDDGGSPVTSEQVVLSLGGRPAARRRPRGLLLIAGAVVAVLLLGLVGYLLLRPTDVTVPSLTGKRESEVREELAELGLRVGKVTRLHDLDADPGTVRSQRPAAGTEVRPGSRVALELAIHLPGPTLEAPADGARVRSPEFPHLTWTPVPDATGYRVIVEREWCLELLGGRKSCDWIIDRVDITGTTSARPTLVESSEKGLLSGRVRWQVSALDDAGRPGSPSQIFEFRRPG